MPHHCSVPGCTSNSKSSPSLSFHIFPTDPDVRRVWIRNIRRDEQKGQWTVNASTRVCSLHFTDDSYHEAGRKRKRKTERQKRMLKPGASPTIFECFPEHLHPTLSKRKAPASRHLPSPKRRDPEDPPTTSSGDTAVSHFGTDADFSDMNSDDTDLPHEHCQCVQDLQESIKTLRSELSASLLKTNQLMQQLQQEKNRKDFSLDRFKNDEPGPKPKLSHLDQFFLTMVRLRLGLTVEDLADRFGINPSTVSRTFITWINLMYVKFKELPMWMSQSQVNRWMPPYFKKWYPTTRVIIDATAVWEGNHRVAELFIRASATLHCIIYRITVPVQTSQDGGIYAQSTV